ncbi:MAG TPA: erythromycin esterase family protein [Sphingomicrobium sp.]|nr:erythromycin esterase family protein [Sphingomicrobium sp.]
MTIPRTAHSNGCAGVYGLDLCNVSGSMRAVIDFLEREDPELARLAQRRDGCLRHI